MRKQLTNLEFAEALESIAAFYREHPEMPVPHPSLYVWPGDREAFLKSVKTLSSGGKVEKYAEQGDNADAEQGDNADYCADRNFAGVEVKIRIGRRYICRLIKPAVPAVYECPESLLEEAGEFPEVSRD